MYYLFINAKLNNRDLYYLTNSRLYFKGSDHWQASSFNCLFSLKNYFHAHGYDVRQIPIKYLKLNGLPLYEG